MSTANADLKQPTGVGSSDLLGGKIIITHLESCKPCVKTYPSPYITYQQAISGINMIGNAAHKIQSASERVASESPRERIKSKIAKELKKRQTTAAIINSGAWSSIWFQNRTTVAMKTHDSDESKMAMSFRKRARYISFRWDKFVRIRLPPNVQSSGVRG